MRCADALRACVQTRMSINKKHKHKKKLTVADSGCDVQMCCVHACLQTRKSIKKSKNKKERKKELTEAQIGGKGVRMS